MLNRVTQHNRGPLANQCLQAVFRELISGSRALEKYMRVSHLGPAYTYSHLAAMHRFGQSVEYVPVGSIGAVFEEVNRGHCDYGLVPIENSTDGRIADTLDMFTRLPVQICGEVNLPIHHCLLGMCPRSDVQEVYSKAAAVVAVPQLAEPAFAAGAHRRSHQHRRRPPNWPKTNPAPRRSPARKRPYITD